MSCAIIVHAHRLRLPRVVQLRMLINVAVDLVVGAVPLVGDAADFFWKSNSMNLALLERHAAEPQPARAGDWIFVSAVIAAVLAFALVPLALLLWIGSILARRV